MKDLLVLNGTMGVGKSATCRILMDLLQPCAYLDGDWCWTMRPFVVSEANKAMVMANIAQVLRSFLANDGFPTVLFSWVIQTEDIFRELAGRLDGLPFRMHRVTLVCSEAALRERLGRDVAAGLREPDVIERSVARLGCYGPMPTVQVDVSAITARVAAQRIAALLRAGAC